MRLFSKSATAVFATLALLMLAACATQPEAPPPEPEPEPAPPTTDIWTATSEGNIAELAANKHAGADLDGLGSKLQVTPLTVAAALGRTEAAKWLLDNGANVNAPNGDGSTALNAAAFLGRTDIAMLLIDNGIDTSVRNYEGQSAADVAQTDWETTEYYAALLQLEVDRAAVEGGRKKIIARISGSSEAGSSGAGWEELIAVIFADDRDALKAAFAAGADQNARDPNSGGTLLIAAAFLGRAEMARVLFAVGTDVDATNNDGATALEVAELDWETTEYIASMLQIPLTDPEGMLKGKAEIAEMLRAKQ